MPEMVTNATREANLVKDSSSSRNCYTLFSLLLQSFRDSVKNAPTDIDTSGISHGAVTSSWLSRVRLIKLPL